MYSHTASGRSLALTLTLAFIACSEPTAIEHRMVVSLDVDRFAASVGDTVRFTASVYNPTHQRVQVGNQCGPPLDVVLIAPDGSEISVLVAVRGPAFTCELNDAHFADPRETERLELLWPAEGPSRAYEAVARTRCREYPACPASDPVPFGVRP